MKLLSRYVTLATSGVPLRIALKGLADAAGKAAMLVITVVAARRLNPDPFAILAFAMATGWLLGVATDAGLSMYLARETAREPRRSRRFVLEIVGMRAGLAFLAATVAVAATPSLVPRQWRLQFVLVVMAQLCGALVETIAHYFRGLQRSEIESAIHAAYRLATLVLALIVLWWWRRLDYLALAMLIPAAIAIVVSLTIAMRMSEYGEGGAGMSASRFYHDVFPLGAAMLISALYFRIDVYFIQQWHGFQPVGGYNAAFRLVEALRLLPAAVMAVTFPLLVQARDTALLRSVSGRLAAAGALLAVVCAAGAPAIVPLIYGARYDYAVPAFAVLSLALPLFFLNYALTHQVIGWDGHRAYLVIVTLALLGNVAANLMLVPQRGIVGAAIATVLTEIIVTAGCVLALQRLSPRFLTKVPHEGSTGVPHGFDGGSARRFAEGSPRGFAAVKPSRVQELAVLRSVTYAALFEYPLTLAQLQKSLIGVRADAATVASWWANSAFLQVAIDHQDGRYFPAGRHDLLRTRARREALSRDLLERDRRILSVVAAMPFVRMVALSGSLAHLNAERSADLDLFVITAPHRVWSVTLSLLVIARVFGWRRRLCLNYVISEDALQVQPADLYSANQIIHLRPILGDEVFARFVDANPFVREIYPNFALSSQPLEPSVPPALKPSGPQALKTFFERVLSFGIAHVCERAARAIYGRHLHRRATSWQSREQVQLDAECLKLHTRSHRAAALEQYELAVADSLQRALAKETIAS